MLINGIIWLVAAVVALVRSANADNANQWLLIAAVFAVIGMRWIVKHFKDRKKAKEE